MTETPHRDAKLVELLNEAYAKEKQLESALDAHVGLTTREDYAKRLKAHLKETKSHATKVSQAHQAARRQPRDRLDCPGPEGLSQRRRERVRGDRQGEGRGPGSDAHRARIGRAGEDASQRAHRVPARRRTRSRPTRSSTRSPPRSGTSRRPSSRATSCARRSACRSSSPGCCPKLSVDVAHDEIPVSEINGPACPRNG